ncbi:MAG: TonB family protein [Achromobacter sp.]
MFDVLGIAPTSDAKAIRRAYAAALKQIDQQTQQAVFEELRAAYERALAWARHHQDQPEPGGIDPARPEAEAAGQPPAEETAPPQAGAPAGVDFRVNQPQVNVHVQTHADGPENTRRMARQRTRAIERWVQALMQADATQLDDVWRQIQADPALLHLDAAEEMSAALLHALAQRPDGRMALFRDASARYGWNQAGLKLHGRPAVPALVDQLEQERAIWRGHAHAYRKAHERVIKLLLKTPAPSWRLGRRVAGHIHRMRNQVPLWFTLQVPPGRHEAYLDAAMRVPRYALVLDSITAFVRRWWWLALIVLVVANGVYLEGKPKGLASQSGTEQQALAARGLLPSSPSDRKVDERLTITQEALRPNGDRVFLISDSIVPTTRNFARRLIVPPMNYPFSSALKNKEGQVVLGLHLSAAGVTDAWVIKSSGFSEIDQGALSTLRRGRTEGDFPPSGNVVQFTVTFTSSKKK